MLTLRALQSAANNQNSESQMTWDAINQAGSEYGAPDIDYDRFDARFNSDPILKQLVDRYDEHGLVVKTDKHEAKPEQGQATGEVSKMAKRATQKAMK